MTRKSTTNTTSTTTNHDDDADVVIVETTEAGSSVGDSSLAVVDDADMQLATEVEAPWMAAMPKGIRDLVKATPVLIEGQLAALVDNLPGADAESCRNMFESLNPVREGLVTSVSDVRIPSAKIFQGTGDDPSRPTVAPVGSLYSSNTELLLCADKALARQNKVSDTLRIAVVLLVESRSWWKPKRENFVPPVGVDPNSKAPICQSPDRKRGTRYGACDACPYRPFAKGTYDADSCSDDATIYFVVYGFKGLYSMQLKSGSLKLAVAPLKRIPGKLWDRWMELSLVPQTNAKGKWFVAKIQPFGTDEDAKGLPTSEAERHLFKGLSSTILHGAVMQSFARVYNPQEAGKPSGEAQPENTADPDAIAKAAATNFAGSGSL